MVFDTVFFLVTPKVRVCFWLRLLLGQNQYCFGRLRLSQASAGEYKSEPEPFKGPKLQPEPFKGPKLLPCYLSELLS